MIADLLLIAVGLGILVLGGDFLVRGAVALAIKLNIAPVIIGLTVLAFGTSAPELIVSVAAVLSGQPDIALGNVVGSNITNVLVILGATAIITPVLSDDEELGISWRYAVAASCLLILLCFLGPLIWWHGIILLVVLALTVSAQLRRAKLGKVSTPEIETISHPMKTILIWLAIGLIALPAGAHLLVTGATDVARMFGISDAVIGLTLVAVGTSLPELAASIASALRGRSDLALGNVIGSNLFNILAIMGITALFGPLDVPAQMLRFDLWFMLVTTLMLGPFLLHHVTIGRFIGAGFLSIYAGYVIWLLF